jgi:hypothetical protein
MPCLALNSAAVLPLARHSSPRLVIARSPASPSSRVTMRLADRSHQNGVRAAGTFYQQANVISGISASTAVLRNLADRITNIAVYAGAAGEADGVALTEDSKGRVITRDYFDNATGAQERIEKGLFAGANPARVCSRSGLLPASRLLPPGASACDEPGGELEFEHAASRTTIATDFFMACSSDHTRSPS